MGRKVGQPVSTGERGSEWDRGGKRRQGVGDGDGGAERIDESRERLLNFARDAQLSDKTVRTLVVAGGKQL